jgi:hypothetical protein
MVSGPTTVRLYVWGAAGESVAVDSVTISGRALPTAHVVLGSTVDAPPDKIYVGSDAIDAVYVGSDKYWPLAGTAPSVWQDSFTRADGVLDNADWDVFGPAGNPVISSNAVAGDDDWNFMGGGVNKATNADHYAQMRTYGGGSGSTAGWHTVFARANTHDYTSGTFTAYAARIENYIGANQIKLYKWVSGTGTEIGASSGNDPGTSGSVLRLECDGSTITVKRDGTQVIQVTDTAVTTGTRTGFRFYCRNDGPPPEKAIDDWEVGDL